MTKLSSAEDTLLGDWNAPMEFDRAKSLQELEGHDWGDLIPSLSGTGLMSRGVLPNRGLRYD